MPDWFKGSGRVLYAVIASLFSAAFLLAQSANISLRGQVTDQSGAAVPAVTVTVIGRGEAPREVQTDEEGRYAFRDLSPGTYTLRIRVKGFADFEETGVAIGRGQPAVVDARLIVALEKQEVTVQGESSQVTINPANNASAVVLRGTEDLQALSDDPTDLQADLQALAGPSAGPNGGAIFIDGFTSGAVLPAKESIREIRINQNPFSPEYDKLGYGRIEIFTKPGTDRYHGTVDYNFGHDFWNTRNPYSVEKAPFLLSEIEGNAGGPLGKRASFVVEFQRNLVDNGSVINAVTVDPQTFAIQPFIGAVVTPGRFTRINPRVDYQLNDHHTLVLSYGITQSHIHDSGIGAYDLASRGYYLEYLDQTVQATETAVLGTTVNETRFQYYRTSNQMIANNLEPETHVLGSFNGGGSNNDRSFDTQNNFELQNYTSMIRSKHTLKFGARLRDQTDDSVSRQNFNGTFTFAGGQLAPVLDANNQPVFGPSGQPELAPISSIQRYQRTLVLQQLGLPPAQIRALGGGATQFRVSTGVPELSARQIDLGVFIDDEWRLRPNVTMNLGLRYEVQTNIQDNHDFAPRVAVAWAPGGGSSRGKTVLRAGFGMFYDRFPLANTITARRYNGIVQQQYVVTNPDFFPNVPSNIQGTQTVQQVSPILRAPYIVQSAVTLERQLPRNTALAVTYTNSHGVHQFRSTNINAPLPGTNDPAVPDSGTFPFGHPGPVFLMESSGLYNQNQVIANVNTKFSRSVTLFGFYVFNKAMSNTDGIGTFPANPYDFAGEYGPAATDVRHRVTFGGSVNLKWDVRISPFVVVQSGVPFDITTGSDPFGTTLFNARPGIATDPNQPGAIETPYGPLNPNPTPGETLLSRNYGRGPGQVRVNLRISKAIGFGSESGGSRAEQRPSGGGPGTATIATTGRGIGGILGMPKTAHRYNLVFSMAAQNLLNHTNPGPIQGDITSPLFGLANQIAGGPNGEGMYETANNRRLEMQVRFTF